MGCEHKQDDKYGGDYLQIPDAVANEWYHQRPTNHDATIGVFCCSALMMMSIKYYKYLRTVAKKQLTKN